MTVAYSTRTRRRLIAICAGLIVVYLGVLTGQRALDGYRAREQVVLATRQIERLREQNLSLQSELASALQDSEIERLARNELGLIRPGDHAVVLIWPGQSFPDAGYSNPHGSIKEANWRAWFRLFFDFD